MSQVIVVASGKGGTGKSTVTAGIAAALCNKGYNVLIVDCDSGLRGIDIMFDVSKKIVFDAADAVSGSCEFEKTIYKVQSFEKLKMIPAPFNAEDEMSPMVFKQLIESIKNEYDYVIIDAPAGIGTGLTTAASPADMALLVTLAEPVSIRGCAKVRKRLADLEIQNIRLIINCFNKQQFWKLSIYEDLDEVIDTAQTRLIGLIPYDFGIVSLTQKGILSERDVWSPSLVVFDCIASRIEGKRVPLAFK